MLPKKTLNLKDTRQHISTPFAMSTKLYKKKLNLTKKNGKKKIAGHMLGQDGPEKKLSQTFNLKRRDSESSTDIDRQNPQLRHEI